LEYIAVLTLEEVAVFGGVSEDGGGLAEVGVYPYADFLDET